MQVELHSKRSKIWLVTCLLLVPSAAAAADAPPLWSVRALAHLPNQSVELQQNGIAVETANRDAAARMERVSDRMAGAYGMATPELLLTRQRGPNAFVTIRNDGNPVLVMNTEMLRLVGNDDDLMATVIGHELGHLAARHPTEGANRATVVSLIALIAGVASDVALAKRGINSGGAVTQVAGAGAGLMNAKFSRDQEREADRLGLEHMAMAGYEVNAAPRLWRLMAANGAGGAGYWMDSHPSSGEREHALQALADAVPKVLQGTNQITTVAANVAPPPISRYTTIALTPADQGTAYANALAADGKKDYLQALQHFETAASTGDERAIFAVGVYAAHGWGIAADPIRAHSQMVLAADHGFLPAMAELGFQTWQGRGTAADPAKAEELLLAAHERGSTRADGYLSLFYLEGPPIYRDLNKSESYALASTKTKDPYGALAYALLLKAGKDRVVDPERSFAFLQDAIKGNIPRAFFELAIDQETGFGTQIDRTAALASYKRAAALGMTAAKARIDVLEKSP